MPEYSNPTAAVIGGGPAGLMAAEVLSLSGVQVDVYDAMPSLGRKFLLAGIGGLNITHSEPYEAFCARDGERRQQLQAALDRFPPDALRSWVHGLGVDIFVGSSGRVIPTQMKAATLLRAWLRRLRSAGVRVHVRHRWLGWDAEGGLRLANADGELASQPRATVLALGGASWPRLGSDGAWAPLLQARGVPIEALQPANCGFDVALVREGALALANAGTGSWSAFLRERYAGQPVK